MPFDAGRSSSRPREGVRSCLNRSKPFEADRWKGSRRVIFEDVRRCSKTFKDARCRSKTFEDCRGGRIRSRSKVFEDSLLVICKQAPQSANLHHRFGSLRSPIANIHHRFGSQRSPMAKIHHRFGLLRSPIAKIHHRFVSLYSH